MIVVLSTRPFELTLSEIGQQTTQTMEVYCAQSCKLRKQLCATVHLSFQTLRAMLHCFHYLFILTFKLSSVMPFAATKTEPQIQDNQNLNKHLICARSVVLIVFIISFSYNQTTSNDHKVYSKGFGKTK